MTTSQTNEQAFEALIEKALAETQLKSVFLQRRTKDANDGDKSHRIQTGTDARA